MKFTSTILPIAATLVVAVMAETCENGGGGQFMECGNEQRGAGCCMWNQYCQPWNPGFYQCRNHLSKCEEHLTDVDLYGDDLQALYGLLPDDCADKCAENKDCVAFTFVNNNPGSPACYLKKGFGQQREKKGAMSCKHKPTEQPCNTAPWGFCGTDGGASCCSKGQYCQPWNPGYYQCINTPEKCSKQHTNVDFYGNDIKTIYGVQPDACCEECTKTDGCKAYTFINSNPGSPACYLKSGEGERRDKIGAVSGLVN